MRTLIVMRGAPGTGKSTTITKLGLDQYTLSSDAIRLLYSSPKLGKEGFLVISAENDKKVWKDFLSTIIEIKCRKIQKEMDSLVTREKKKKRECDGENNKIKKGRLTGIQSRKTFFKTRGLMRNVRFSFRGVERNRRK